MGKAKRNNYRPKENDAAEWQRRNGRAMVEIPGDQAGVKVRVCQPPYEGYLSRGVITDRQCWAARRLKDDYELGICGARNPEAGGSGDPAGVAQVLAARAYAVAVQAIGKRLSLVVLASVCEELTSEQVGRRIGERRDGVMALLRAGLDALADHYEVRCQKAA